VNETVPSRDIFLSLLLWGKCKNGTRNWNKLIDCPADWNAIVPALISILSSVSLKSYTRDDVTHSVGSESMKLVLTSLLKDVS
jgi:hypothetical protein